MKSQEQVNARKRVWYSRVKASYQARLKEWRRTHPGRQREYARKCKYGLSVDLQRILLARGCAICGDVAMHVDHDHKNGKVRGVLCVNCNVGLGRFHDDPDMLKKAINYLYESTVSGL